MIQGNEKRKRKKKNETDKKGKGGEEKGGKGEEEKGEGGRKDIVERQAKGNENGIEGEERKER